jgi:hypothetical protein
MNELSYLETKLCLKVPVNLSESQAASLRFGGTAEAAVPT